MRTMGKKERVAATLARQPVDRVAVYEHFWDDTHKDWTANGWVPAEADFNQLFSLEIREGGWINTTANLDWPGETVNEDEETISVRDGNYAVLRRHKLHDSTPEHVAFGVTCREEWEKLIKPHLLAADRRRIPFADYRRAKEAAAENDEFFCWSYVAPFEQMHPVCGHENMLLGMIDDPDWIADMVQTYTDFTIRHAELLFAEEGEPDGFWFYEDMGFKDRPFMSPDHYCEFIQPGHRRLCDWAHGLGKKVIMHSCGFIEPLLPHMIDAGIDCLQVIEVKAGMDLLRLLDKFADKIAFCGGMDVREIYSNDKKRIDALIDNVLRPALAKGAHYIHHSDHSIPHDVHPDTLRYFQQRAREVSAEFYNGPAAARN